MAGHKWSHATNSSTARCYVFGNYFYAKNLRYWFFPFRDIDDQRILQFDWTGIHLVNDLENYLIHDKKTFFSLRIQLMSLWITSNVAIPPMTSNVLISYQTMDISGQTKPAVVLLHAIFLGWYLYAKNVRH